jgi:hypothetical protein
LAKGIVIAIGAGIASLVMLMSMLTGAHGAVILAYLAPLPLFYAGTAYGVPGVLVAGIAASTVAAGIGWLMGLTYMLAFAAPAAVLVRQALLARPGSAPNSLIWYPPGMLAIWLAAIAAILIVAAHVLAAGTQDGLDGLLRPALREVLAQMGASETERAMMPVDQMARALPPIAAVGWMVMMAVNAALAQALAVRFGQNRRPSPDMAALILPEWLALVSALAAAAALAPGQLGKIGLSLTAIAAVPFLFQGLAVIHVLARRYSAGGLLLFALYALLFMLSGLVVVVVVLGLIEQWLGFRRRMAGGAPDREET